MSHNGHSPRFPAFMDHPPTSRTLAIWQENGLLTEGEQFLRCQDYREFKEIIFDYNLLPYVESLPEFLFLPDMIYDPRAEVRANHRDSQAIVACIEGKRNMSRWIVQKNRWPSLIDEKGKPLQGMAFLAKMREGYTHCGVGTPPTPGSLGQALMRRAWWEDFGRDWWKHRHTPSSLNCYKFMREHKTGGRIETPGLGQVFEMLLEFDLTNAYAAHYGIHPAGAANRLYRVHKPPGYWPHDYDNGTWFAKCQVRINKRLALGPFPIRIKVKHGTEITYPTEPGTYTAYLWKEQAEDALRLGCDVGDFDGFAWKYFTDDNQGFVLLVDHLLRTAPDARIRAFVKGATVAGIGRHGMDDTLHILVPRELAKGGDMPVIAPHSADAHDYYLTAKHMERQPNLLHWQNYTEMQCSRTLFKYALPYAENRVLVSTKQDNFFISRWTDEMERYRPKTTVDRRTGELNYIFHPYRMKVEQAGHPTKA